MDCKERNSKKKLEYILNLQSKGLTPKEIASNMKYSNLKNLNDFMRNQGYRNQDDKYIPKETDICPTNGIQHNEKSLEVTPKPMEDKCIPNVVQDTEEQMKLNNILNKHEELLEMLAWFREVKAKYPTVDLLNDFTIDYSKSNIIKTTVRVDEDIWNTFSDICKNKYSHLSKVDILSQILKNFNDENN